MNSIGRNLVPVGSETLGRILDADAVSIDGGGNEFSEWAERLTLAGTAVVDSTVPGIRKAHRKRELFPIGIKPFDLFAPVPKNGTVSLIASWGVGKMVLLYELIRTMKVVHSGRSVVVTVEGGPRESAEMESAYRESGILDSMTAILVPKNASGEQRRQGVLSGLTIARHTLEVERRNVLFAVDQLALDEETIPLLRQIATHDDVSMLTVISGFHQDELDPDEHIVPFDPDARIVFSPELARRGLYPAIDPFESGSKMLIPEILGSDHVQISADVRRLLATARERIAGEEKENGNHADNNSDNSQIIDRAARVERFLTQPFYVAQLQNGIPGEQVSVEESLQSFAALLKGDYDHLPVGAFSYIGRIEEANEEEGERRI